MFGVLRARFEQSRSAIIPAGGVPWQWRMRRFECPPSLAQFEAVAIFAVELDCRCVISSSMVAAPFLGR
jgi:hypothetical protein